MRLRNFDYFVRYYLLFSTNNHPMRIDYPIFRKLSCELNRSRYTFHYYSSTGPVAYVKGTWFD